MLRHVLRTQLPDVVDIWVDAFAADPFLGWMAGSTGADWTPFRRAWMTFIAELCFERGHTYLGDGVATAWVPPDLTLATPEDFARGRSVIAEHAGEARADEALGTIVAARGQAMEEPHWTLQYVGVRPALQGSGAGAAAISAILTTVDADGLPCGLTSTNPRNVTLYERLGFAVTAEVPTPDGVAVLRPMRRDRSRG